MIWNHKLHPRACEIVFCQCKPFVCVVWERVTSTQTSLDCAQPQARLFLLFLSLAFQGMAVGAISPSIDSALVIGPAVMLVFLVFGGLYTTESDVPKVLRWIPRCSVINRAYEGLCCNELAGLEFENEGPSSVLTGKFNIACSMRACMLCDLFSMIP